MNTEFMEVTILTLLAGCVVLLAGSWTTVRATVGVAARLKLSPTLAGMSILPWARIAAPIIAAAVAAIMGRPNASLGILLGTFTASAAIPVGLACLIAPPKPSNAMTRTAFLCLFSVGVALLAMLLRRGFANPPTLQREGSLLLLLGGVGTSVIFLAAALRARGQAQPLDAAFAEEAGWPVEIPGRSVWLLLVLGIVVIVGGAVLAVNGARATVDHLGLARGVISATVVGAVLSVPQIMTVFRNAIFGDPGVMFAQIGSASSVGLFVGLGICAMVEPLTITHQHAYALACFACACIGVSVAAMVRSRALAVVNGVLLLVTYAWFSVGMLRMPA